jgi:hypothetical protein
MPPQTLVNEQPCVSVHDDALKDAQTVGAPSQWVGPASLDAVPRSGVAPASRTLEPVSPRLPAPSGRLTSLLLPSTPESPLPGSGLPPLLLLLHATSAAPARNIEHDDAIRFVENICHPTSIVVELSVEGAT